MQPVTASLKQQGRIPALSQHAGLRYFNFITLYIAQGIPEGMLFFGYPCMDGNIQQQLYMNQ